jgi:hypothetical protein
MASRRTFRIAAFACAAGLLGAACGGGSDAVDTAAQSAPAVSEAPEPAVSEAPETGGAEPTAATTGSVPDILQFTSSLVGGGEIDAAALAGTPTAFWFWAPT